VILLKKCQVFLKHQITLNLFTQNSTNFKKIFSQILSKSHSAKWWFSNFVKWTMASMTIVIIKIINKTFEFFTTLLINRNLYWVGFKVNLLHNHIFGKQIYNGIFVLYTDTLTIYLTQVNLIKKKKINTFCFLVHCPFDQQNKSRSFLISKKLSLIKQDVVRQVKKLKLI